MGNVITKDNVMEILNSWKGKHLNVFIDTSFIRISISIQLESFSVSRGAQAYTRSNGHYITTNMLSLNPQRYYGEYEYTLSSIEYVECNIIEKENALKFLYRDGSIVTITLMEKDKGESL